MTRLTVAAALLLVPGWAVAQTTPAAPPSPSAARPSPSPSPSARPSPAPTPRPSPTPPPGPPEFVYLLDGDRVTGTITSETARVVRIKTLYGALVIPKSRIARVVRADGKEEVLHAAAAPPSPSPSPVAPKARLVLAVTGNTFFMAWDRKDAPADPTLRLELRLDEEPLAAWTDTRLDPEEVPGAVVNAFSFAPADVAAAPAPEVQLSPAEVQPGRVVLRLELPAAADPRTLRIAYQLNQGSAQSPAWHDVATASVPVPLRADGATVVQVRQDRGRMEFAGFPRRKMRNVETFRVDLAVE